MMTGDLTGREDPQRETATRQWTCRCRDAAAGTNTEDHEPHQKLAEEMPRVLPVSANPAGGLVFGSWPPELRANAFCTSGHLVGGGDSR